ncbi:hypothetical protein Q9233_014464 [Columba guinea]|nr:hypothetical protein Q9233_014464 [Columba guinea]
MFLKKQDLTRKKKQNFLSVRSTYSLVFIKKKISGMSCTDLDGSGKVLTELPFGSIGTFLIIKTDLRNGFNFLELCISVRHHSN